MVIILWVFIALLSLLSEYWSISCKVSLIIRSSTGVFSCKATDRSKVCWTKFSEVGVPSSLSTSCWLWFGRRSIWCSRHRVWRCCWFCTGQTCRDMFNCNFYVVYREYEAYGSLTCNFCL